jgi:hypothetical protein
MLDDDITLDYDNIKTVLCCMHISTEFMFSD